MAAYSTDFIIKPALIAMFLPDPYSLTHNFRSGMIEGNKHFCFSCLPINTINITSNFCTGTMKKKKETKELLTIEGLNELKKELDYRSNGKRAELRDSLEDMRSKGDLSENEGYSLTIDENNLNEVRISELEAMIANAKVITKCDVDTVCVGSKVTVINGGEKKVFEVVGEDQANPLENKISYKSPIGMALMDKKDRSENKR